MKILFLVPYPLEEAPSQRFRFEQYFDVLSMNGIEYEVHSFFPVTDWKLFYGRGNSGKKLLLLIRGFLNRVRSLLTCSSAQFIFIHREAAPLGPPIIEWLISKLLRKKIIYDFDDAIWMTDRQNESVLLRILKWRSKVAAICSWSYKISCGNNFLCQYATQFNTNVVLIPTTVDTMRQHNPALCSRRRSARLTIGWTGSHSTLKYLQQLQEVMKKVELIFPDTVFLVIADRKPDLGLKNLKFITWNVATEIEDLCKIDIGIMPLPNDEWSKGKCGFKALQYMALQIPTVASPVGVNNEIIESGRNGFLAVNTEEWLKYLTNLIKDPNLRIEIGANARKTVEQGYSKVAHSDTFLGLFV
jgi:glycosyltransferase involved in cell wall biosynthesis